MAHIIGKVSATEKSPSTCDDFSFWLTDNTILSPFDIVRVRNRLDGSDTYGVVQDILHVTDSPSHISSYVSSDFGDAEAKPMTRRYWIFSHTELILFSNSSCRSRRKEVLLGDHTVKTETREESESSCSIV